LRTLQLIDDFYHMPRSRFCEKPSQNYIRDKVVAKIHTKTLDNLVIYRLNIIETDFRLGKTTLFEHFYRIFAVVKRAIQPCSIFPGLHGCISQVHCD
jgi:hypothetical protein